MGNEFMTLVKDTALAQVIAVSELFDVSAKAASGYVSTIPFIVAAIFYLGMNFFRRPGLPLGGTEIRLLSMKREHVMEILSVKNLCKSFQHNKVLNDISLTVSQGEVLAIIGPSGSGKSTLLRCINQFETVDSGEINVCGQRWCIRTPKRAMLYTPIKVRSGAFG
jgi:ABC-type glutathione transport system ATPase component